MNAARMIFIIFTASMLLIAYDVYPLLRAKKIGAEIVPNPKPYEHEDATLKSSILVLGDSTAVGVGTSAEKSIASLLSHDLHANVENYAVTGAVTSDLVEQTKLAKRSHYDLIEIQVGANDVIGFKSIPRALASLDVVLSSLSNKSNHIVVLTAGDIGKAPIFRWPLSRIVSYRTRELREGFMRICTKHGALYVDIFSKPDVISKDPQRYHSPDGLHLNAAGYAYWYALLRETIRAWPEFR